MSTIDIFESVLRENNAALVLKIYSKSRESLEKNLRGKDFDTIIGAFATAMTDIVLAEYYGVKVRGTAERILRDAGLIK